MIPAPHARPNPDNEPEIEFAEAGADLLEFQESAPRSRAVAALAMTRFADSQVSATRVRGSVTPAENLLPSADSPPRSDLLPSGKRRERTAKPAPMPLVIPFESTNAPETGALKEFFASATASLLMHLVILLVMSLIVCGSGGVGGMTIFGSMSNGDGDGEITIHTELAKAGAEDNAANQIVLEAASVADVAMNSRTETVLKGFGGTGIAHEGGGTGSEEGMGFNGVVPIPKFAVTKGSFTVWTEPNDPAPLENYEIVIHVRLPDRIKRYQLSDLSGTLQGTDNWRQSIPGRENLGRMVTPVDRAVQVRIPVPGAAAKVRDTIRVNSLTLREQQTIVIEF